MARIPVGTFGYRVANLSQQNRQQPALAFGAAEGLAALSDSVSHIAGRAMAEERRLRLEQEAEAKAAAKEAARVQSITAQATAKNQLADLHDDLVAGLSDGRYDKTKLQELQAERSQKLVEDALQGVSPEHQELVRASLLDDVGRSRRELRKVVDTKNRQDIGAGIGSYMEQMQRYASRGETQRQEAMANVDTFLQSAGPQAGMNAEQIAKASQGFKEGVTFNWLDRAISSGQGNGKALAKIAADLAADKFPELDPQKRNFLEAKIQRNQQHLLHQAEVAERRNLTNLDRMEKRLAWYVENGRDIPASEMAAFEKASKGTAYEGAAQMIVAEQKAVSELLRLSPAQMAAKIKEVEAGYGATPSREQIVHVEKLKRFAANTVKLLNESPLDYAVQRDGAVVQPLDLTQPGGWADNLSARVGILKEQSQRTGAAPKGLFPQEAQALGNLLRNARPDQQREILAGLSNGFSDMGVFKATMQQIAPDNPVVANAGELAARGITDSKHRHVADILLQGNSLLRQDTNFDGKPSGGKLIPMPSDVEMRRNFSATVKGVYAGNDDAQNVDYQSARAAYAKLSSDVGDHSGVMNYSRWNEAVKIAIGDVEKWNGSRVIMPRGVSMGAFKDKLKAKSAELVSSGLLDLDVTMGSLWDMPLISTGDGVYAFRIGDGKLIDKSGKTVEVDLNEATP